MVRFDAAYRSPPLSKTRQIQTVGAVHHRFLWIHPFLDGNGRVARLMSHALLKRLGIGTSLWSVARGLARDEARYKTLLAQADGPREGDRDGRGNLTQRGLIAFCKFFLDQSVDQVRFMSGLLEPATLLTRIEIHIEEEVRTKRLPRGSFAVLREAVINGEIERSNGPRATSPRRWWIAACSQPPPIVRRCGWLFRPTLQSVGSRTSIPPMRDRDHDRENLVLIGRITDVGALQTAMSQHIRVPAFMISELKRPFASMPKQTKPDCLNPGQFRLISSRSS